MKFIKFFLGEGYFHTQGGDRRPCQGTLFGKSVWTSVRQIFVMFAGVSEVAREIKGFIEDFKPFIPLIQGLRNPGMRNRHWEQVKEILLNINFFG